MCNTSNQTIDLQTRTNFCEKVDGKNFSDPTTTQTQLCLKEPLNDNLMFKKIKQQEQLICRLEQQLKSTKATLLN